MPAPCHGSIRDLLRAEGIDEKVGGLRRSLTLEALVAAKPN
jgi:hypothetical protein